MFEKLGSWACLCTMKTWVVNFCVYENPNKHESVKVVKFKHQKIVLKTRTHESNEIHKSRHYTINTNPWKQWNPFSPLNSPNPWPNWGSLFWQSICHAALHGCAWTLATAVRGLHSTPHLRPRALYVYVRDLSSLVAQPCAGRHGRSERKQRSGCNERSPYPTTQGWGRHNLNMV